jgi:hypothetical protein
VNQPRAADDFPMIRARMVELRRERARPRAADDFRVIRARMEELRRERAQVLGERRSRSAIQPNALSSCREKRIGPEAEPARAAPHVSATARRAPIVRAAS